MCILGTHGDDKVCVGNMWEMGRDVGNIWVGRWVMGLVDTHKGGFVFVCM